MSQQPQTQLNDVIAQQLNEVLKKTGGIDDREVMLEVMRRWSKAQPYLLQELAQQVINEKVKAIGRWDPCHWLQPRPPCRIGHQQGDMCLTCIDYRPWSFGQRIGAAVRRYFGPPLAAHPRFFWGATAVWIIVAVGNVATGILLSEMPIINFAFVTACFTFAYLYYWRHWRAWLGKPKKEAK